jgi:hypothetical protein
MAVAAKRAGDPSATFRESVREALISLEAASLAAEMCGQGNAEERAADQASIVEFVDAALSAVRKLDATLAEPKAIFPNDSIARAWCEAKALEGGLNYPDPQGRRRALHHFDQRSAGVPLTSRAAFFDAIERPACEPVSQGRLPFGVARVAQIGTGMRPAFDAVPTPADH